MATVRKKRIVTLLFILWAVCMSSAHAWADSGIAAGTTVSGTVRVYLSSIGSKNSVDLTIDGSYTIGADSTRALDRGESISVLNSGGTLVLYRNGQSETMGSRFKLRRHQSSAENGVRIAQARYPSNLYPGDIEFIAKGGNVQIIVHVYMEDYMRGVLPYEMDNSFPLEALKAQAVAARTYALKKMSAQAATYDVVDTTSDQVYNGTPSGNARCAQAVTETSGIVGTVNGEYMASYYTASNGGQTESVANAWGSGSYAYLQVRDDPYDLRNGASIAKSVTFYKDGTTSVPALTQLLREEAAAALGVSSVTIERITSVTPHSPKYDEPSRVYKKVDVGLSLSGYGQMTVTLDYFAQIESLCSMSINVLKNETLSVSETVGGYKLTARRFGHGVGMSQRGAQQMAAEGLSYDQILEFYYPGLVRTRYTMTRTLLPALDGSSGAVNEPVSDSGTAIVTLSNPLSSLNLRKEPNASSSILATMAHGTQITLLSMNSAWSRVQYGTLSGYVKNEYISVQEDGVDETPSGVVSRGTATVALSDESQTLNLRAAPTLGAAVLSHLRHGQTLTVLERYETWTYVQMGTLTGYVMNDYVIIEEEGSDAGQTPSDEEEKDMSVIGLTAIVLPSDGLNFRRAASLNSGIVMTLPQGAMLTVTGALQGGFYPVSLGGVEGFVAKEYVYVTDLTQKEETPAPDVTPKPEQPAGMATVTAVGGLKLREDATTDSAVLLTMPLGSSVHILGVLQDGFYPVRYGETTGFASAQYLDMGHSATPIPVPTSTPTPTVTASPVPPASGPVTGRVGVVTAASGLNLRKDSSVYADVVATLGYGVSITVTGERVNGFYPVRVGTLGGYVSAQYVSLGGDAPAQSTATPQPTSTPQAGAYRVVVESTNGLNLRAQPYVGSEVTYVLPYGTVLTVLGEADNGFLRVEWAGYAGYVSGQYVTPFGAQGGE